MTAEPGAANPLVDPVEGAPPWVPNIDDEVSIRRLWWAIFLVLAAAGLAFIARGADRPADPQLVGAAGSEGARLPVPGFGETLVRVTDQAGRSLEHCLLVAESEQQRAQGLRGVTDLRGHRGMLFRFQQESTGPFNMRGTPLPLSISFFDEAGRFLAAADMEPCRDREGCPLYEVGRPYWRAVEVPQGQLEPMGIGPGSRIEGRGPCPPP